MKLPPKDWHPQQTIAASSAIAVPHYPQGLFKSRSFYGLWICYVIGTLVGLSAIGISSPVGEEIIQINPTVAARSVSLFAVFNGVSRPLFGWLSDRFKPHYVALFFLHANPHRLCHDGECANGSSRHLLNCFLSILVLPRGMASHGSHHYAALF